jgi:L-malate glycosyltransferase
MKILQIIQKPQLRGAEIFACQLSEELVKLGHEVDVLYLFTYKSFDLQFNLKFISAGANRAFRFSDFRGYRKIAKIIKEGGYEIVQANAGDTMKYAVFSRFFFKWKARLVYRNANQISAFMVGPARTFFNRFLLRRVDYVISVSDICWKDLVEFAPFVMDKSSPIPIGTYEFDDIPPMDVSHSHPVVIHIGSFVREKNQEFLIRSFKLFLDARPDAMLWLVGDGPQRQQAEKLVDDLGISTSVVFWGYKKDVIRILKSAQMLVLPSRTEGLPGVILEAFACRVPVIASDVGGIPEAVVHNETGICLKSGSHADYAAAMEKMLDSAFRDRIVAAAYDLVTSKYDLRIIAGLFEGVYETLLNTKPK